jgi:Holliday junction resolvasome RuvABC endonuclease subunit
VRVLGLDLSNKTGWAIMIDGKLEAYGTYLEPTKLSVPADIAHLVPEYFYIYRTGHIVSFIQSLIARYSPDKIILEQTCAGRFRTSQKMLEFVHCMVLQGLKPHASKVSYVDVSQWRSYLQIRLTKDQRQHNKNVKSKKTKGKLTPKHLAVNYVNQKFGLALKLKDNDAVDAICLCLYGQNHTKKSVPTINIDQVLFGK